MNHPDLKVALEAAEAAVNVIRHYAANRDQLNVTLKGRHDLLTQADIETEEAIIKTIAKHHPDDSIYGEETSKTDKPGSGRTWIIDPIDGTTNFTHGFPIFCVSIALYADNKPVVGVIREVNSGETYSAAAGQGAYLNGNRIRVSDVSKPSEALLGTGFPYRELSLIDDYLKVFKVFMRETHGVRRPGSASYDLACVAAGRLDGFYEYGLAPWDVAAGALIIREAGGMVMDWKGGDEWLNGRRIICGNDAISSYILEKIGENFEPACR